MTESKAYRKKPVEIQAAQWFKIGDHPDDCRPPADDVQFDERPEGLAVRYFRNPEVPGTRECKRCGVTMHDHGWVDTLEGGHIVCPGDFIITGVQGELYPCKPDIFAATYEDASVSKLTGQIVAERLRQIADEGWTPDHDLSHSDGELVDAALAYLTGTKMWWPWDSAPKFGPRDRIKAGALLLAERDRQAAQRRIAAQKQLPAAGQ